MPKQKFKRGDLVYIGEMPMWMRHFSHNLEALVLYSYDEKYGGQSSNAPTYAVALIDDPIYVKFCGAKTPHRYDFTAWYEEAQLTKVGRGTRRELAICLKMAIHS